MNCPKIIDDNVYIPGFSVLGILGVGNQSVVYLARQRALNRLVAIKTVRNVDKNSYASKRLQREGQIVAKLELSNVVRLHERFDAGDQSFVVFEYVNGGNLRQRMNEGPLQPTDAARFMVAIARTIDEVHQQGVVHLDIKPENILLTTAGEPKVSDFGLAVTINSESQLDSLHDSTVEIEGTPWYMAPEQIEKSQFAILPTTDVYAIGIILYEMLTARPPFLASDRNELFERICRYPPLAPRQLNPKIPPDLETICLRCLVKNPNERYRSAGELANDLDRWLHHQPIRARKVGYTERLRLWRRRNPIVASLLLCLMLTLCSASIGFVYNYVMTFRALNLSRQHEQERQTNLVRSLRTVDPKSLPLLIETFQSSDATYAPLLVASARQQDLLPIEQTRYQLALIGEQTDSLRKLPETLLEADVSEFEAIVRVLEKAKGRCRPEAWDKYLEVLQGNFENNSADWKERLRSATALVHHGSSRDWTAEECERIADGLLNTDPLHVLTFSDLLSPIHDRLIAPLAKRYKDPQLANFHQRIAVNLLAEFARGQPAMLAELLLSSDKNYFQTLLVPLLKYPDEATAVLKREMESETSNDNREERRSRTVRQARAALGLLRLGFAEIVWPLLKASDDPSLRSEIIHSLRDAGVELKTLVERYPIETDVSARRALLLAMGNFPSDELPMAERDELLVQVLSDFRSHPDPGIHTACEWLIKQWKVSIPVLASNDAGFQDAVDCRRDWFVNTLGQSFTVIRGPIEVRIGSPDDEPDREAIEIPWTVTIDRTFAIGMKEVTIEEFKKFMSEAGAPLNSDWEPTWPATNLTYLDAARYCRWLSEQEGIPEDQMCYPPVQEIKEGFVANPNYLRRSGYRLPSEVEQECSMRAGAMTRFCFGEWEELLGDYAWYIKNAYEAPRPTGLLKPNDYGLFDAHGNVREMGQEWISHTGGDSIMKTGHRKYKVDIEDMTPIVNVGHYRIARSGSFKDYVFNIRCSRRDKIPILSASVDMGIRLARTLVHHPPQSVK